MEQLLKLDDESSSEVYKDYVYHFAVDENGLSGYLKVTFTQEPGQPVGHYVEVCINDQDGNELINCETPIEWVRAAQMIAVQFDGQRV
jgi:hypothetical protein